MQVVEVHGSLARCQAQGVQREVSLFLLQHEPVAPGDYLLVHVGYAIQKIAPQEARSAWEAYDALLATAGETPGGA